jgi:hypothetical protein
MYKATATPAPGTTISSFNCTPLSGVVFPITTTTVNCVAIASNGLQATATFKVTVTPQQEVKVPPATLIRELLQAVSSSKIPRGIRLELTGLLQIALHNLQTPPHRGRSLGGYGQAPPLPFAQLFAPLDGLHLGAARRGCSTQSAINDLELFIAVIKHDQKQRRPQIPSALASAGIRSASSIVASLACKSQGNSGGR